MFRKRQKRDFPPDTFIPTPARVCAIIQLCLAFSALLWNVSEPFVGEIFTLKSRLIFYQDVMGIPSAGSKPASEKSERLMRNAERFEKLPIQEKAPIIQQYAFIQKQLQRSFWNKLGEVFHLFAAKIPMLELAWIFFSILIPILLLKKTEGASQAVWLLPLIVALYAAESRWQFKPGSGTHLTSELFPEEKMLVDNYLNEPLKENIFEQQEQLMKGWKYYLVKEWADQNPASEQETFNKQVEEGEFRFNMTRLRRNSSLGSSLLERHPYSLSYLQLILYFFWNVYFAYTAWKYRPLT